jgi:hypothetical protein
LRKIVKILFLLGILGYFLLPLLQQLKACFPDARPLDGYYEKAKDTVLTADAWFDRVYQEKKEDYFNENFGFRTFLVRLNNQVNFSLFDEFNVRHLIKGKNNYLFTKGFLESYSGKSFEEKRAESVLDSIQNLNSRLLAMNKKLLVCIAPCKESFYPEFLPDSTRAHLSKNSYYNYYRSKFLSNNIPLLDFNDYFIKIRSKIEYPLFTQGALHWTNYGAAIAMDTLFKRMRYEIGKNMNLVRIRSVQLIDSVQRMYDDESRAMNLLVAVNSGTFAEPVIETVYNQDSCYRPKVMLVGDSFYYQLNNTWIPLSVFSKESFFLYYYRTAISYGDKPDQDVSKLNMKKELENTDIVILFYTLGNLTAFPYGAGEIENALK